MSGFLDYLNSLQDPYLVSRFQNYFGVYRVDSCKNGNVNGSLCSSDSKYEKSDGYHNIDSSTSNSKYEKSDGYQNIDSSTSNSKYGKSDGYQNIDSSTSRSKYGKSDGYLNIDSSTSSSKYEKSDGYQNIDSSASSKCKMITVKYGSITEGSPVLRSRKPPTSDSDTSKNSPVTSDNSETSDADSDQAEYTVQCRIQNRFWYYFFSFGAGLGYEMFYVSFFPFWIWNIDGAVCRRVINVWVLIMYVGQAAKDIICWPRPAAPPVMHLEPRYVVEFAMPSTHAMVGAAVPFSLLYFTHNRYEYPVIVGIIIATCWCVLVCCSRLYMGMHTVLDIIGGLVLVAILMTIIFPFSDMIDHYQLTDPYSPLVTLSLMLLLQIIYPKTEKWTPARGDTAVIMGTGAGFAFGSWLNYHLGIIRGPPLPPPYSIMWPGYKVFGLALLRAIIGISCVVATRAIFKNVTHQLFCFVMRANSRDLKARQKILVEIPSKMLTYCAIGFVITYVAPFVFRLLCIERETMFTEV